MDKRKKWIIITLISDIIFFNLSIILAFFVRYGYPFPRFNFKPYLDISWIITLIQILLFYTSGLYKPFKKSTFYPVFFEIVKGVTINGLTIAAISYFGYKFSFPRKVILLSWVFGVFFISLGRIIINAYFKSYFPRAILILGTNAYELERIKEDIRRYFPYILNHIEIYTSSLEKLEKYVKEKGITDIIVENRDIFFAVRPIFDHRNINLYAFPDLYELAIKGSPFIELGGVPLLEVKYTPLEPWEALAKRIIDIVLSFLGLLVSSPIFLGVFIAIKIEDGGPIFFVQKRVGFKRKIFCLYKFRTMREDVKDTTILTSENDKRVTRVGAILRRWKIDEIPQLFNILKGDMSLVGPRPEQPPLVEKFMREIPFYEERFLLRPGLTGLAQVYGRYDSSPSHKLRYDIAYIYNYSLFLDIKIIILTIRVVFTGWGTR